MHIEECLAGASPAHAAAFNGQMNCAASGDREEQEHKAMVKTAQQLYEQFSQSGAPSLTMMEGIRTKMTPMKFQVTQEAAEFATEAHIHHMCTAANLIRACCFEGLAYGLVTGLGPERFTEWKTALINEAAGKAPHLFGMLEEDVRKGNFQPRPGGGALKYGPVTPEYDITELVDKDMPGLRKVCKDLQRAEFVAAKEHDGVRAAARDVASAQAQPTSSTEGRRTSGADQLRHKSIEIRAGGRLEPEPDEMGDFDPFGFFR
jgi:hypothetical protein